VYIAWLLILGVTNIFFLVALVIIGILLMMQVKVNQYAFKIIMPRFLVAIVLAQFSWLLCDFAMDFTVIIAWVFTSFMNAFHLNASLSLGGMLQNNGTMRSVVDGIQMCMIYGGVGGSLGNGTDLSKPGSFIYWATRAIPAAIAAGKTVVETFNKANQPGGDLAGSAMGTVASVALLISGACETIGRSIMPMIWISVLAFISSVMLYLGMTLIRTVLLYFLVIISPLVCVIFIFPDFKKTVEKWTSMFGSLLIVYPMMVLVYAVCYMIGYYLSLTG
jgi:hypothetical protein